MAEGRGPYSKNSDEDRRRIVQSAESGNDWQALSVSLGVKYQTAYAWVRSGECERRPRGGSQKKLNEEQINFICEEIERDPQLTLLQLSDKVRDHYDISVSPTSVHRYLSGRLITLKKAHVMPANMNDPTNKELRKQYVEEISQYMVQNKTIVWMDETNLNLFCRRTQARSPSGSRAVVRLPSSKGPNIHVIGAMSAYQVLKFTKKRGSFNAEAAKTWVTDLLSNLPDNMAYSDIVLVCDNAPCHTSLQSLEEVFPGFKLLRLGPYSPMLNPIEGIWSKMKSFVKLQMRVPDVSAPGVCEQRLIYVETIIDRALQGITNQDCVKFSQHSQGFFRDVLNLQDMSPGC